MATRRSARSRKPNPKYNDAAINLELYGSDFEAPDPSYIPKVRAVDDDDADFDLRKQTRDGIGENGQEVLEGSENGDLSMSEADVVGVSDGSDIATPDEDFDAEDLMSFDEATSDRNGVGRRFIHKRKPNGTNRPTEFHYRGFPDAYFTRSAKEDHWKYTFGSAKEDVAYMVRARDRWSGVLDVTFPSKRNLREVLLEKNNLPLCEWYNEAEGARFRKRQRVERLKTDDGCSYLTYQTGDKCIQSFLMGPTAAQRKFSLEPGRSMNLADPWTRTSIDTPCREGWILNIGLGAQAQAWSPANAGSRSQYLAVGFASSEEQKNEFRKNNVNWKQSNGATAFTPGAPTKSCIQIWEFGAKEENFTMEDDNESMGNGVNTSPLYTLDMEREPKLKLVIGTEWGDVRRLSWCPTLIPKSTSESEEQRSRSSIGLLGGVWGDGSARVCEVRLTCSKDEANTDFVRIQTAAFESLPPTTIFTSLAWLSSSDLALGCANGSVAIFNIPDSCPPAPEPPKPYFYEQTCSTYILALTPALPQYPHLLATASMDGLTKLLDLRAPHTDSTNLPRVRFNTPLLSYLPTLNCHVTVDENDRVKLIPLRRFFSGNNIVAASASLSALATSPFHPCVLAGSADGSVLAANGIRRLVGGRNTSYQQCWFTHDWSKLVFEEGISRIRDGFKAEKSHLGLIQGQGMDTARRGTIWTTIFEEMGHITGLAWNANAECAGWAVAVMGCGLMRVEDISLGP